MKRPPKNPLNRRDPALEEFAKNARCIEAECMRETCAVELRVRLPQPLAAEVEEVQRRDPELLSRLLFYTLARRTIFDQLAMSQRGGPAYASEGGLDAADGNALR